jgi:hypothetical protein
MITDMMLFILGGFGGVRNLVIKKDRQLPGQRLLPPLFVKSPG